MGRTTGGIGVVEVVGGIKRGKWGWELGVGVGVGYTSLFG